MCDVLIDERVDSAADKPEFVWFGIADPNEDELRRFRGDRLYRHLLVCKVQTFTLAMTEAWL